MMMVPSIREVRRQMSSVVEANNHHNDNNNNNNNPIMGNRSLNNLKNAAHRHSINSPPQRNSGKDTKEALLVSTKGQAQSQSQSQQQQQQQQHSEAKSDSQKSDLLSRPFNSSTRQQQQSQQQEIDVRDPTVVGGSRGNSDKRSPGHSAKNRHNSPLPVFVPRRITPLKVPQFNYTVQLHRLCCHHLVSIQSFCFAL